MAENDNTRKSRAKFDWDAIERDFITQNLLPREKPYTLKDAAIQWGAAHKTVRTKASEGGWRDKLREAQAEHRKQVVEETSRALAIDESEIRARQTQVAQRLQDFAVEKLSSIDPVALTRKEAIELYDKASKNEREAAGIPRHTHIEHEEIAAGSPQERLAKNERFSTIADRLAEILAEGGSDGD